MFSLNCLIPVPFVGTPSLSDKSVDFAWNKTCYISFLRAFYADFNHVIFEMIPWPQLEGIQSWGTMGQAYSPVSAVTKGSNPLSLLPKQAGRLGPECPKAASPPFSALLSIQELHG